MGVSSSKSDYETCFDCRTPEFKILRTLHNLLPEKIGEVHINSEDVGKLIKLYNKSEWLKHECCTDEKAAINCQVPASRSVINSKKLRNEIPVEVFDPTPSEATGAFFTAFKQMLHKYGIIAEKIAKFSDGKAAPVIVICNMASRFEADIDKTLISVKTKDYSRVVLIALHVKPKHALPQEGTKEKLSFNEEKYRDLRGVVDIAFTGEDRFYNCQMNDDAVSEIRRLFVDTT